MFVSDDEGATWQRSNVLDNGVGRHDHAGSCESTVIQRPDDSLYLLLRNESGFLTESISTDDGLTWSEQKQTAIPSVTCCAQMNTLADGTVTLLWIHHHATIQLLRPLLTSRQVAASCTLVTSWRWLSRTMAE